MWFPIWVIHVIYNIFFVVLLGSIQNNLLAVIKYDPKNVLFYVKLIN